MLRASGAPASQLTAVKRELSELKPRLRQLQASAKIHGSHGGASEPAEGVGGSRASQMSARRLQRQRAREMWRYFEG